MKKSFEVILKELNQLTWDLASSYNLTANDSLQNVHKSLTQAHIHLLEAIKLNKRLGKE